MTKKYMPFIYCTIFTLLLVVCAGKTPASVPVSYLDYVPVKPYAESERQQEPVSGKAVSDYFKDEKIFAGWNLGNTLDSHNSGFGRRDIMGQSAS